MIHRAFTPVITYTGHDAWKGINPGAGPITPGLAMRAAEASGQPPRASGYSPAQTADRAPGHPLGVPGRAPGSRCGRTQRRP